MKWPAGTRHCQGARRRHSEADSAATSLARPAIVVFIAVIPSRARLLRSHRRRGTDTRIVARHDNGDGCPPVTHPRVIGSSSSPTTVLRMPGGSMPSSRAGSSGVGRIPVPLTRLIGRAREIRAVQQLLSSNRLVTLTGPGGCGKSRLAIAVAAMPQTDPVLWVSLAAVTDPEMIVERVAAALGVGNRPQRTALGLVEEAVGSNPMLIVLDNCEHLVDGCAEFVESLLVRCLEVRIIATSRQPLAVPGEQRFPVPALSVPDPRNRPPMESLVRYDSVMLLADRASAAEPSFRVTADNAAAVASICARLDGIPLAIELAAARSNSLTIDDVAVHLRSSFDLLTTSGRSVLPQQRTIRATIDWSVRLLSDTERSVLFTLGVFAGPFTLNAAVAVAEDFTARTRMPGGDVVTALTRLVDRSLVLVDRDTATNRYHLLEAVRQYGIEQLSTDEVHVARRRHAEFFLEEVAAAEPSLHQGDRWSTLRRFAADQENLDAALAFTADVALDNHLRLTGGLFFFWFMAGRVREGRRWLEAAVKLADGRPVNQDALAHTLSGAGLLAWTAGELDLSVRHLERAIGLFRAGCNDRGLAQALRFLSGTYESVGDLARARGLVEESVALARRGGEPFNLALGLARLGITCVAEKQYDAAMATLEEGLVVSRRSGDGWATALTLRHLGIAGLRSGRYQPAREALQESLDLLRVTDDRFLSLQTLETFAAVLAAQEDYRTAAELLGAWPLSASPSACP